MVNPEEDFVGYMEDVAAAEAHNAEQEAMWERHMQWRESTVAGRAVTALKGLASRFKPFFDAVVESVQEEKSVSMRLLGHLVRLATIFAVLIAIYVVGRILQNIIGEEIVVEEEIEVVEEITRSELEKEKREAALKVDGKKSSVRRRGARDKKA
jgi:hypothetical protein